MFTTSIATILDFILLLRLGCIVGDGGLAEALLVIMRANGISFLTSYSLVAIASNRHIKGGSPTTSSQDPGPECGCAALP